MDAITLIRPAVTQVHEQLLASRSRCIHTFDDDVEPHREMEAGGQRWPDPRDDLTVAALRFGP